MTVHLDKAWPGNPAITQPFGPTTYAGEPPGYLWPDGSVTYYAAGGTRHDHVHCGIDLALQQGTPLTPPAPGTITFAGEDTTGFGNCVKIEHRALGIGTLYGHLSEIDCHVGEELTVGPNTNTIALTGNTGNSSGPHLHFTVFRLSDRHYVDPMPFLAGGLQPPEPPPAPRPAPDRTIGPITFVHFVVKAKPKGLTRVFDGPCTLLQLQRTEPTNTTLICDAYMKGEPRHDADTGKDDPLWFHLAAGGWVPSAHTIGYPPGVQP